MVLLCSLTQGARKLSSDCDPFWVCLACVLVDCLLAGCLLSDAYFEGALYLQTINNAANSKQQSSTYSYT